MDADVVKALKAQMDTFMDNQKRITEYNEENFPTKSEIEEAYLKGVQEVE